MTLLLTSLSWIFGHLPLPLALAFGRGLGSVVFGFSRRKREVLERIQECLGVDAAEARAIQKRMYRNLGMTVIEFFRMPHMSEEDVRRHITFENTDRAVRGSIGLVAHTGNWEMTAAAAPLFIDHPLSVVVKALKPVSLNTWVTQTRSRWGTKILDRRGSVRELLKVLKDGENLAFILDQNTKRNWGVFVDFFGKPACTSDGLAQMAARSGKPIFPFFCRRLPDHRLRVTVGEEVPGPKDRSPEEILRVTADCSKVIEDFIRQYPDQWIWMHRRWRTRPLESEDGKVKDRHR